MRPPSQPAAAPAGQPAPRVRRCPACASEFPEDFVVCPRDATPLPPVGGGDDPLLGALLAGSYRVTRALAQGGMARLYEAEHVRVGGKLAVKVLHELYARSADGVARFEREAHACAKIRSPHVVQVVDILRAPDGRPCIVWELLEGEDLQARLDRVGKMSAVQAIPILREVCRGLAAAHAGGVVHRDLKPSNVFLTQSGGREVVKIVDFGVAKLAGEGEMTQTGAVLGTPAYMAPEQAQGARDVDARADVYAAGAVLYRTLTGRPPYETGGSTSPLVKLLGEAPPRARTIERSIPPGLEAVIEHAMARDPASRPAGALELEDELAAFDNVAPAVPAQAPAPAAGGGTETTAGLRAPASVADHFTRQAQRARPLAVVRVVATAAVAGLSLAVLLDALVRLVSGRASASASERFLVAMIALAATATTAVLFGRAFRSRWRGVPAVSALSARVASALATCLVTFGALEMLARALGALGAGGLAGPGAVLARAAIALAAAAVALWRRD